MASPTQKRIARTEKKRTRQQGSKDIRQRMDDMQLDEVLSDWEMDQLFWDEGQLDDSSW